MKITNLDLIKILIDGSYLEKAKAEEVLKKVEATKASLFDYLIENNLLTNDLIGQAIAESYKLPYADLNTHVPTKEQILKIPEKLAQEKRLILFSEDEKKVIITSDDLNSDNIVTSLKKIFPKKEIKFAFSLTRDVDSCLTAYRKTLETRFSQIIAEQKRVAPEIIEQILVDAANFRTSDIHFEPQEKEVIIRFRIDGVLQEAGRIPKEYYENIVNRLKIQAHLRIDDHFSAQDGAIRFNIEGRKIDARLSLVPTLDGETIVLRLLADYMQGFALSDLGLSPNNQKQLEEASGRPFGMVLVTGPTGSGKTTTLYAILKTINNPQINITTIEDPVEFRIAGANQIQVNRQTDLTFAKGLRSIVRQDPDVILVGEIRDKETAEISINAALTGHLLFSTFHANDAATSIPRLIDMGVEPFLLSSTLEVIVAQRLVRVICESCRHSKTVSQTDLKKLLDKPEKYFSGKTTTLYEGKGCSACSGTGFRGRVGIFEFIKINSELQSLILKNPSSQEIWQVAQKNGSKSLFEDGLDKVKSGLTTLEELLRVANPPKELNEKKRRNKTTKKN
ncbi:type II/IV secretion system protein [Patescibacteria group bacterium]|nr:type II/IV secretion system protein [Patescibacteria group bacterium]